MLQTVITALFTYIATSIDEIPVLFMLYTKADNRGRGKAITGAYFAGTFLLILMGLLGAFGLGQIPAKWIIGFAGVVPLVLGIKILFFGEDEEEEKEKATASAKRFQTIWIQVLAITLGLGADDLGVYIPLFTTLSGLEIILMLLVFASGTAVLCLISHQLTRIDVLTGLIEKYERLIIGLVFIAIGFFVMAECGTLQRISDFF